MNEAIPDEIMREAHQVLAPWVSTFGIVPEEEYEMALAIAISIAARDTAARKECTERARDIAMRGIASGGYSAAYRAGAADVAAAIEATIGGRDAK